MNWPKKRGNKTNQKNRGIRKGALGGGVAKRRMQSSAILPRNWEIRPTLDSVVYQWRFRWGPKRSTRGKEKTVHVHRCRREECETGGGKEGKGKGSDFCQPVFAGRPNQEVSKKRGGHAKGKSSRLGRTKNSMAVRVEKDLGHQANEGYLWSQQPAPGIQGFE